MRAVIDLLNATSCDDHAADGAMGTVCRARGSLSVTWLPVLDGIRACTAMTGYQPVDTSSNDLGDALVWVLHNGYGWLVVTDPLDDTVLDVTPEEARALGIALQIGDWAKLLDTPEERQRLHEMLDVIAHDPVLSAEFFANFNRVDDLANALGHRRYDLSVEIAWNGSATDELNRVDRLISDLATAYQSQPATAATSVYPTVIEAMDPYAAALFVQHLALDPGVLAKAADDISVRTLSWGDDRAYPGNGVDTPADIVFRMLSDHPLASTAYLKLAVAYPQFLIRAADNQALAEQMMLVGTDPRYGVSPEDAGRFIVPFTNYLLYGDDWFGPVFNTDHPPAMFLGSLAGPWLSYFIPLASQWSWDSEHPGRQVLGDIVRDDAAMTLLVRALGGFIQQVSTMPMYSTDGTLNHERLEVVTDVIATLRLDLRDETIRDAAAQRAWVDVISTVANLALGIAINFTPAGPFAQAAMGVAGTTGLSAAQSWLEDHGVLPPSNETSRAKAEAAYVADEATTMTTCFVVAVGQLIDQGRLPANALTGLAQVPTATGCPLRDRRTQLIDFVNGLQVRARGTSPNQEAHVTGDLLAVIDAFVNNTNVDEACPQH